MGFRPSIRIVEFVVVLGGTAIQGFGGSQNRGEPPEVRLVPGGVKMTWYKMRSIVDFIRKQGPLPTDERGDVLDPGEILAWFGLDELLGKDEQRKVKEELVAMIEAQEFMERFRFTLR